MALMERTKGRYLIIICCILVGFISGWLPQDYLKINIGLLIIGFLVAVIIGLKSIMSSDVPNFMGGVIATPSNIKKLHKAQMTKNDKFVLLIGISLFLSSVLSLGLRIEYA